MLLRALIGIALAGLIATGLPIAASAQSREFSGRIDQISNNKLILQNLWGYLVWFVPGTPSVGGGLGRTVWKKRNNHDWVTVSWKMVDKPRIAYKVKVLPPRKQAGEDE